MRDKIKQNRIWELDATRGLCILLMVVYHTLYDLHYYFHTGLDLSKPIWRWLVFFFAGLFILLSGVSSTLSRNPAKRGCIVFALGMVVTLATYLYNASDFISFGILHFLGISMVLAHFIRKVDLSRRKTASLTACAILLITGILLARANAPFPWLIPLGYAPYRYSAPDYFPLLPWFAVFLLGMLLGKTLYQTKVTRLPLRRIPRILPFLGRHTLWIYILHQPIVLGILSLIYRR